MFRTLMGLPRNWLPGAAHPGTWLSLTKLRNCLNAVLQISYSNKDALCSVNEVITTSHMLRAGSKNVPMKNLRW
mgnify:CR=1 FL=1